MKSVGQWLQSLTISQQIGLLFVIIFGVLSFATAVAFMKSLQAPPDKQEATDAMWRDLRALWVGTVLFWISWATGAVVSTLLFAIISFLALREFITLTHTRRGDHRALLMAFFFVLPVQYWLAGGRYFDLFSVFIPVYAFAALPILAVFGNDATRFLERTAKIQWGTMVCVYGMSHAPALLLLEFRNYEDRGAFLVLYLVIVVVTAQIAQHSAKRRIRTLPAARHISRTFSWRAWALGALAAGLVGGLLYWITPFKAPQAILIGLIAGGCGTLGELVMQALKRDAGVRHWGGRATVTGAVGLLDRVAPLCFAAPVFFHSLRWYFGA
ncbi:phosphatidate cytidylyltransferase [Rhizobacter sp. J219]|jgi:phosphatidate cytidylyltransferase|uniref:phosphatidate cytidylyltransferase n=1 Tax=Rhizobacter sp. J219 TaxID=2898430 RepID=UPI002150DA36|nr:phosphatidate cytidylyltransferase [Rhizobacter sp. J219]MCR5883617.1 phosphatidate cytidylyltransferase [Rhizobacter sp. J219]